MNHVSGGEREPLVLFRAPRAPRCSQRHFIEHCYAAVQIARFSEWGPPLWDFFSPDVGGAVYKTLETDS